MKRIILFLLPFVLICSQKMYGQASFFDAHVSKYGELEQVLGDKWDKIDSLIVHGPINKADFKTIVRCARDGSMRIVNLQYAQMRTIKFQTLDLLIGISPDLETIWIFAVLFFPIILLSLVNMHFMD